MKSNKALQDKLNFQNEGQKVWYAAHVLKAALTSSPPILVQGRIAPIAGKRQIPAYAGFAGSPPLTAAQNTTGFVAGERFPGRPAVAAIPASDGYAAVTAIPAIAPSPAYATGVAVPMFPPVPARAQQIEVAPVFEVKAITTPKIDAIKGWEDAISIVKTATELTIDIMLPLYAGGGLAGSSELRLGEITPSALQANGLIESEIPVISNVCGNSIDPDVATDTLEQMLYRNALMCNYIATDIVKNNYNCKRLIITLYPDTGFDIASNSMQIDKVLKVAA